MQANSRADRFNIDYFEGVNSLISSNLAKKFELKHAENVRAKSIGVLEKREGITALGNTLGVDADYGIKYFPNSGSNKALYRFAELTGSGKITIHYLNNSSVWTALASEGTNILKGTFDSVIAEDDLFLVNYVDQNRYVKGSDGTSVIDSTTTTGHLYNSPNASKITYYKGSLYVADYLYGAVRYKTSVLKSSKLLGIVALISGDPDSPYTSCEVTDRKFIYTTAPGNTLDVYRGTDKVGVITITGISGYTLVMTTAFEAGFTELLSADELWVPGTYSGAKQFRWVNNGSESGEPVKEYNSFRLSGGDGSAVTMFEPIGNVLMIANKTSMAIWNNTSLQNFDYQIGCTSSNGYVKSLGALYFLDYNGVFVTSGEAPKLISTKIENFINGATKAGKEACAAGRKGRSVFFAIGNVTLYKDDGSTDKVLSDVVLEYNITQQDWYPHIGIPAVAFETFVDSAVTNRLVMTTTLTDKVTAEFLSGETDLGAEIPMLANSYDFYLSGPLEKYFYPFEVIFEVMRGTGIEVFVSLDGGTYYKIDGEGEKGANILKINAVDNDSGQPVRCRKMSVSFRHSQPQLAKVSRVAITYIKSAEEEAELSPDSQR